MPCEPPRDVGSLKAIRGSLPVGQARAVLRCSPRKQSFFFFPLKTKKRYIYIFIFSCRVAPEQVCMATICGSPQPQAEDQGVSPTGWDSVGGLPRDAVRGSRPLDFPVWGGPRQGELAPLQAALSGLEASTRWPSPGAETPPLSLWGQKPQGRGLWGPHGTQALGEVPGWASRGKRKGHSCLPAIHL